MAELVFCSKCNGIRNECGCRHRSANTAQSNEPRPWDNRRWRSLSKQYRANNPFCEVCFSKGKYTGVEEVHHKVKIKEAPHLMFNVDNLMSVCRTCHKEIEAGEPNGGL